MKAVRARRERTRPTRAPVDREVGLGARAGTDVLDGDRVGA